MTTRIYTLLLIAVISSMTLSSRASAHHSISAEFDSKQKIVLMGTVTRVAWGNPHTFFYLDVKDPKTGTVLNWACELGSPNMLLALGWNRNTLSAGMNVSLTGILARDGSHKVIARGIVAEGNKIPAWPSEVMP